MDESFTYDLQDLLYLMQRLRTPGSGCPWDLEQTYLSITPSTIEEAYEVVDAIEREDYAHLNEELGDLLFQVVFYAQLAKEDGFFEFGSIVDSLVSKLVRRHPHVFPQGRLRDEQEDFSSLSQSDVIQNWDDIKGTERLEKGKAGLLDDVPLALPALQRAQKLQKRVAKVGMDFRNLEDVVAKLDEEIIELKDALAENDAEALSEELGDVLFTCVNLARLKGTDADQLLRLTNKKFERRIQKMEHMIEQANTTWSACSDDELETLWVKAKS